MRFIPHSEMPAEPQVAAGRPIPGTGFAILDDDGSPVGPGETGELHIRSRYTAIGEWRDGQSVAGRLIPDDIECEAEAGPIWRRYAMGDLVRMRPDGAIVVAGRRDRQLKLNGYRVEPVEVEALLRADSDVLDAIVLPLAGPAGPELIAFVAAAPDGRAEAHARLLALLSARMPAHMRPRRLHLLEALPLLPSNKIDAGALARLDASSRPAGGAVH
jgi:acyl-coenzyme A synthetase/AMP-(fatty) acid ligase